MSHSDVKCLSSDTLAFIADILFMFAHRATVAWFVLHRGVTKKAFATFSRAASTDRCLAGRYVSSLRSDTLLPCSM